MYNDQERRKFKRREKLYIAGVRVKQHEGNETKSTGWDSVILHNLSVGGAFFIYKRDLEIGTLIDLKIDIPESMLNVNCVGEATRVEQFKSSSLFYTAIKIIDIGVLEEAIVNASVA